MVEVDVPARQKTRLYLRGLTGRTELFSVQERPDGSLTIVQKGPKELHTDEHGGGIKDQHFSVHPSPGMDAITITQKSLFHDQVQADLFARVAPGKDGVIWPFLIRVVSDPLFYLSARELGRHQKDKRVDLAACDTSVNKLVYILVIAEPANDLGDVFNALPLDRIKISYSLFDLYVVKAFAHMRPAPYGFQVVNSTLPPRVNGVGTGCISEIEDGESETRESLIETIFHGLYEASKGIVNIVAKCNHDAGDPLPADSTFRVDLWRYPLASGASPADQIRLSFDCEVEWPDEKISLPR